MVNFYGAAMGGSMIGCEQLLLNRSLYGMARNVAAFISTASKWRVPDQDNWSRDRGRPTVVAQQRLPLTIPKHPARSLTTSSHADPGAQTTPFAPLGATVRTDCPLPNV